MILKNEWIPNHFFQPIGFSLVMALFKFFFENWGLALAILNSLLSTLTLYFIYKAVEETWPQQKYSHPVLIIGVFHAPWILFTGFALSETFFTFFLSLLLYQSAKLWKNNFKIFHAFSWGLIFILAFFLKGTLVFLGPISYLFIYKVFKWESLKKFILPVGFVVSVGLIFHGILTYKTINKFQLSATAGGLNFVEGKCPYKWNVDNRNVDWLSPMYYQLGYNKSKKNWDASFLDSSYFMKEGIKCIMKYPATIIQSLEGIPLLFFGNMLWPGNQWKSKEWMRLYELFFAIFVIVGLTIYIIKIKKEINLNFQIFTWILPIISLFVCVYIFKSEIRFRIPFDVFFIPLSYVGWRKIL